jgi:hypothetical protein
MFSNGSHIFVPLHVGPVLRKNFLAKRVNLHLPDRFHPRAFKAKIKAADSSEQTAYR